MRSQLRKLTRTRSTKWERRIGEVLKAHRIPFRAKVRLGRYEIDFLCGRAAVEVDGSVHTQTNREKDQYLFAHGYVPLHILVPRQITDAFTQELITLIRNNNV